MDILDEACEKKLLGHLITIEVSFNMFISFILSFMSDCSGKLCQQKLINVNGKNDLLPFIFMNTVLKLSLF